MKPMTKMLRIAMLCGIPLVSQMAFAQPGVQRVYARTAAEVASAIETATSSGKPVLITVAPGRYSFSGQHASEFGPSWLPPITTAVTIVGRNAEQTVFAAQDTYGRAFTVLDSGRLVLRNVTITGGIVFCEGPPCDSVGGGAIANHGGVVWLEHCVITGNAVAGSNAPDPTTGGGILSVEGHLHLEASSVVSNHSEGWGGGIAILGGTASVQRSQISGNAVPSRIAIGGGIFIRDAKVTITDSTLSGNQLNISYEFDWTSAGAGLYNSGGTVWMSNSAVVENFMWNSGDGGGIVNGGTLVIKSSTIGDNTAGTLGGGIHNGGKLVLNGVTVAHNASRGAPLLFPSPGGCDRIEETCIAGGGGIWNEPSGSVQIEASVIAHNTVGSVEGVQELGPDCKATLSSRGHNLLGTNVDCTLAPRRGNDQVNINPKLGALEENGDAGFAHYTPLAASPLIDAGGSFPGHCARRDQLGNRRVDGDGDGKIECDIGAIERTDASAQPAEADAE